MSFLTQYYADRPYFPSNEFEDINWNSNRNTIKEIAGIKALTNQLIPNIRCLLYVEFAAFWISETFQIDKESPSLFIQQSPKCLSSFSVFAVELAKLTNCSYKIFLLALLYLHRLKQLFPKCKAAAPKTCNTIGSTTGHRLLLASMVIATKYLHDDSYENSSWANITHGLFSTRHINHMENEMLFFLNYKLYIEAEEWIHWVSQIEFNLLASKQKQEHHNHYHHHLIENQRIYRSLARRQQQQNHHHHCSSKNSHEIEEDTNLILMSKIYPLNNHHQKNSAIIKS